MKPKKIFWGILLVFFGTILLLENFNIIDFAWSHVWRFWPIVLILLGINIVISKAKPKIGIPLISTATVLVLILLAYEGIQPISNQNNNYILDIFENEANNNIDDSLQTTLYSEDFDTRYKSAKLVINGAAGSFTISNSTNQLFDAEVKGSFKKFILKKTETDTSANLELNNSKIHSNTFNSKQLSDFDMALNLNPVWNIDANIGAGEMNLDLSNFKISNVNLKGGAAAFNITLGNKFNYTNLTAETGVSSVEITIPQQSGCRIHVNSGLSAKEFIGFNNLGKGVYETNNFYKSTHKIYIHLKGGLSSFEVSRY